MIYTSGEAWVETLVEINNRRKGYGNLNRSRAFWKISKPDVNLSFHKNGSQYVQQSK